MTAKYGVVWCQKSSQNSLHLIMAVQYGMEIDREIVPQAFNMDYNRNECQALVDNSEDNLFNLRSSSGVSYFEAICLKGLNFFTQFLS